ncbi:hypothetical protein pb186bvf_002625 [Paramecium bursaria]
MDDLDEISDMVLLVFQIKRNQIKVKNFNRLNRAFLNRLKLINSPFFSRNNCDQSLKTFKTLKQLNKYQISYQEI